MLVTASREIALLRTGPSEGTWRRLVEMIDARRAAGEELGEEDSTNELMIALGGGLAIGLSDGVGIDVAYRYHGITTDDPMVHASAVYAGLRIVFR